MALDTRAITGRMLTTLWQTHTAAACFCALQGSDQIRQAFSKRKKGLVLKAYQLNALTDAKVGGTPLHR